MPLKNPEERRKYHAKYMKEVWYPKNRKRHMAYVRKNTQRVVAFIEQYKKARKCMDCGFSGAQFPFVLDFDHLQGHTKRFNVGSWRHAALSIGAIEREIAKCELVCANCHRIRTFTSKR
jgi:hypothetical protein